jgi:hypothetical protein
MKWKRSSFDRPRCNVGPMKPKPTQGDKRR